MSEENNNNNNDIIQAIQNGFSGLKSDIEKIMPNTPAEKKPEDNELLTSINKGFEKLTDILTKSNTTPPEDEIKPITVPIVPPKQIDEPKIIDDPPPAIQPTNTFGSLIKRILIG